MISLEPKALGECVLHYKHPILLLRKKYGSWFQEFGELYCTTQAEYAPTTLFICVYVLELFVYFIYHEREHK